eukprot:2748064-Alexandrium_andersonii.AAC.1
MGALREPLNSAAGTTRNSCNGSSGRPGRHGSGSGSLEVGPRDFQRPACLRLGVGNGLGWPCHWGL